MAKSNRTIEVSDSMIEQIEFKLGMCAAGWDMSDPKELVAIVLEVTGHYELRAALKSAVALYGKPGGPWNVPSDPGSWLTQAREAIDIAEGTP